MRRTAVWLKEQGALLIEAIEDTNQGHVALVRNPENARRVLELFIQDRIKLGIEPTNLP